MELKNLSKKQLSSLMDSTLKSLVALERSKEELLKITGYNPGGIMVFDGNYAGNLFEYDHLNQLRKLRQVAVDRLQEVKKDIEKFSKQAADIRAAMYNLDWGLNPKIVGQKWP